MASSSTKLIVVMVITHQMLFTGAVLVGVNYGLLGNDLPAPKDVINFIKSKGIIAVRIFDPNVEVLEALRGTKANLGISVGVKNQDLASLATGPQATTDWLNKFIIPYENDIFFEWITLGNEAIPGENAEYVFPAIKNMDESLKAAGLDRKIEVTTVVATTVLGTSYPPSEGVFADNVNQIMTDIVNFLHSITSALMVNVYPYFALISDPSHISLDFALFNSKTPVFTDPNSNLAYYNLFDAMFDAFFSAVVKATGKQDLELIVAESGWPSAGGQYASVENARVYNNNFKNHALNGSPPKYGLPFEAYIFGLFNENLKTPAGVEQNFGNFYPNKKPVYPLW
ncbi:Glucan endo-1,3-beta-glucosidase [Thalictrum thalictroides]|uniref:Glucan endo-1,3-beta-glucosidase n=1 Tax=Thalictrum thalictroides TaxID=46969 RepID=A0A7J6WAT9_THATH|nr:Glucan endo-1,3-beta-glucosidase [Thalictrum thalictroides]